MIWANQVCIRTVLTERALFPLTRCMTCYARKASNTGTAVVYLNTCYHIMILGWLNLHNGPGCIHVTLQLYQVKGCGPRRIQYSVTVICVLYMMVRNSVKITLHGFQHELWSKQCTAYCNSNLKLPTFIPFIRLEMGYGPAGSVCWLLNGSYWFKTDFSDGKILSHSS